ncbi:MAG: phosphoribosylformylglycinamidine cyclo-ligase [Chloroflexota bacterium]|nr:phosphoribosylformylglycinamidine cyclo-ligase [Chloroflexota bacterium]
MADDRTKLTYRAAGVDIDVADEAVKRVRKHARTTFGPEVISDLGFFGGLFELTGFQKPVLVSSTDGVGTKLKIACALNKHDTIGADLVNHCVNDIFTCGARPLFFLDYIAMARLVPEIVEDLVKGMASALGAVGCALVGGETAEMPGLYPDGEYDLAGFIVGAVEKETILDGRSIQAGDVIVGLPSSGLHTNGYSLARRVFGIDEDPSPLTQAFPPLGRTLGEELLEPHHCYYAALGPLLPLIKGMAHITGGGIPGNLPRVLPEGLAARVRKDSWAIPPIFTLIQERGNIDEEEMYRTFNMGVGMAIVCSRHNADELSRSVTGARVIGEVVEDRDRQHIAIT